MSKSAKDSLTVARGLIATALLVTLTGGQVWGVDNVWTNGFGDLNYNQNNNWTNLFVSGFDFDEVAVINNGDAVFLNSVPIASAGLNVDNGSLEIQNLGTLTVVAGQNGTEPGAVRVGANGTLIVQSGGSLSAAAPASLIGNTRLVGPTASFQAADINFGGGHVLTAEITDPNTHSPLSTAGNAKLGGEVTAVFNGVTPVVGNSWNLVDAGAIDGAFSVVRSATPLPLGQALFAETVAGGTHGQLVRATVDNQLVLSVDSNTGAMSIENLSTTETEDIDSYQITAAADVINPTGWTSFASTDSNWEEGNPFSKHLSELSLSSSRVIASSESISLGSPLVPPSEFGVSTPLTFEYHVAEGDIRTGAVDDAGINNLLLRVDPTTGQGVILNPSLFNLELDAYFITSLSGSLDPNGWTSLSSNDPNNWEEANPLPTHLSELNLGSSQTILQQEGGAPIDLGDIFDPNGERDVTFEFHLTDPGSSDQIFTGVIEYAPVTDPPFPDGDFDASNLVGLSDLNLVLFNWQQQGSQLPVQWMHQRPEDAQTVGLAELNLVLFNWQATGSLTAAVPEPSALGLLCLGVSVAVSAMQRKQIR
jgi:hypothetical protein